MYRPCRYKNRRRGVGEVLGIKLEWGKISPKFLPSLLHKEASAEAPEQNLGKKTPDRDF